MLDQKQYHGHKLTGVPTKFHLLSSLLQILPLNRINARAHLSADDIIWIVTHHLRTYSNANLVQQFGFLNACWKTKPNLG